jgi:regulator of cell morphogenesis and NO signaling
VLHPLRDTFDGLALLVQEHFERQRTLLFPLVRTDGHVDAGGQPARCLGLLAADHETIEHALETLREITRGYAPPDDACAAWRALGGSLAGIDGELRSLIALERDVLLPRLAGQLRAARPG